MMALYPSWVVVLDDIANGMDERLSKADARWAIESITELADDRRRFADALMRIAGDRCTKLGGERYRCLDSGRSRDGTDPWCDSCIAYDALHPNERGRPMIPVRWRRGETRRGRVFPPVEPGGPRDTPCIACNLPLGNGEEIQLVVVGIMDDDGEASKRYEAGRWFSAGAVAMHRRDVAAMTDDDLDALCAELRVIDT